MERMIGINIGFITNSSSCVHHVPREILDDPDIRAFLEAFEVSNGFTGENLWDRSRCGSVLVTDEQKEAARRQFNGQDGDFDGGPDIPTDPKIITVIYGDEYESIASTLMGMIDKLIGRQYGTQYN